VKISDDFPSGLSKHFQRGGSINVKLKSLLLALCLVAAGMVHADSGKMESCMYQWTDSSGTVHFTDNPMRIPEKHSGKVKKREYIQGEVMSKQDNRKSESVKPIPANKAIQLCCGHDEGWWRERYSSLRTRIRQIKEAAPEKQTRLRELHYSMCASVDQPYKGSHRENKTAYRKLHQEIRDDEEKIVELEKELEALEVEAPRCSVPLEWRK
jgi:hypothetical protein